MNITYTIAILSIFFWLFPAIRQYKTELFWYFFILAIEDPISISLQLLKLINAYDIYLICGYILVFVLYWNSRKKRYTKIMLVVFFLLIGITIGASIKVHYGFMVLIHFTILVFFLNRSIYFIAENGKANLFHLLMLLYETSIILKMAAILIEANTGTAFFNVTTIFQILIAVFFSIFKENDSRLFINLKNV